MKDATQDNQQTSPNTGPKWAMPVAAGVAIAAALTMVWIEATDTHHHKPKQRIACPDTATGLQSLQCQIEHALGRPPEL